MSKRSKAKVGTSPPKVRERPPGKTPTGEPSQLRRGKAFHRKVQAEWRETAEGKISVEKKVTKPGGRGGRIDVHATADGELVGVLEIKASNWDKMTDVAVRRNIRRHIRQIWDYIDSQLADERDVSPGVAFQKRPADGNRMRLIERLFEEEGISVVWDDETVEERRARS